MNNILEIKKEYPGYSNIIDTIYETESKYNGFIMKLEELYIKNIASNDELYDLYIIKLKMVFIFTYNICIQNDIMYLYDETVDFMITKLYYAIYVDHNAALTQYIRRSIISKINSYEKIENINNYKEIYIDDFMNIIYNNDINNILNNCMDNDLNNLEKKVIVMYYYEGKSIDNIAKETNHRYEFINMKLIQSVTKLRIRNREKFKYYI